MYIVLLVLFLQYDIFIGFLFCGYNNQFFQSHAKQILFQQHCFHSVVLFAFLGCVVLSLLIVLSFISSLFCCINISGLCCLFCAGLCSICISRSCCFVYQDIVVLLQNFVVCLFEQSPHSVLSSHQDFVFVFIYLDCVVFASSDNIALHHRLCLFVYPDCVVCISELIVFSVQIKLFVSPDCTLYFSIVLFCPRSGFRYFGFPYCVVLYVLVVMLSIHAVLICLS